MSYHLIYLSHDFFDIYQQNGTVVRCSFSENLVNYKEIIDNSAYNKIIEDFLKNTKEIKTKFLILLSPSLVFLDKSTEKDETKINQQAETFFNYIPLDSANIVKHIFSDKENTFFIAAHKAFYEPIIKVLKETGNDIVGVVPLELFGVTENNQKITQEDIKKILANSQIIQLGNLLQKNDNNKEQNKVEGNSVRENSTLKKRNIKQIILLVVVFCFLLLALSYASIQLSLFKNPFGTNNKKITLITSPTILPTPSKTSLPTVELVKKDDIRISVFNGSGVEGQASFLKKTLENNGYTNIQTGNSSVSSISATIVSYNKSVPKKAVEEIIETIKTSNFEVKSEEAELDNLDIRITTGKK